MIIRKRYDDFVMIKQHDHAQLSKHLYEFLHENLSPDKSKKRSIGYAIEQHDCGWIPFDETPFWNDENHEPYAFTKFPTEPKAVLYEHGIHQVETKDSYAALLCSEHYTRFLSKSSKKIAKAFVEGEHARQQKIQKQLNITRDEWLPDYELLQLFDNLSLYICLNEPGTTKDNEHFFFQKGIPLPASFSIETSLQPKWISKNEIDLKFDLFTSEAILPLKQKVVSKQAITDNGIQKAYQATDTEEIMLTIK